MDVGTIARDPERPVYVIDPDGAGAAPSFRIPVPDFNFKSLRVNAVLRWEFRPGSAAYVVWTQRRQDGRTPATPRFVRDLGDLFCRPGRRRVHGQGGVVDGGSEPVIPSVIPSLVRDLPHHRARGTLKRGRCAASRYRLDEEPRETISAARPRAEERLAMMPGLAAEAWAPRRQAGTPSYAGDETPVMRPTMAGRRGERGSTALIERDVNEDFRDLLRALLEAGARFLVVARTRWRSTARPRATGDLDVWIAVDPTRTPTGS